MNQSSRAKLAPARRRLYTSPDAGGGVAEGETMRERLDAIDWKILAELQRDGRVTNVELSRRVGISAPPCLRRMRALEDAGIIRGYRALLDDKRLGYEVTVFVMVHLTSQAEPDLVAFDERIQSWPLVRECWMLSGDIDFVLKCVAPDLAAFQAFLTELTATPNVRSIRTALALRNCKDEPSVPLETEASKNGSRVRETAGERTERSNG
jgi:DNA-binding Lrp family transcriptional regulator